NMVARAVNAFRVVQQLEIEALPDPQRRPAGDGNEGVSVDGFLQRRTHGSGRTGHQVHAEVVRLDGLFRVDVDARPGIDADDLVVEIAGPLLQLRNAVHIGVGG